MDDLHLNNIVMSHDDGKLLLIDTTPEINRFKDITWDFT
jgi:hypothetical protein